MLTIQPASEQETVVARQPEEMVSEPDLPGTVSPGEAGDAVALSVAPDWKKGRRIALKLLLAAVLILILMLFSSGEVDFVYKGF